MSQRLTGFDICLPGIVAGLTLAAVLLAMGEAEFPLPSGKYFPAKLSCSCPSQLARPAPSGW